MVSAGPGSGFQSDTRSSTCLVRTSCRSWSRSSRSALYICMYVLYLNVVNDITYTYIYIYIIYIYIEYTPCLCMITHDIYVFAVQALIDFSMPNVLSILLDKMILTSTVLRKYHVLPDLPWLFFPQKSCALLSPTCCGAQHIKNLS